MDASAAGWLPQRHHPEGRQELQEIIQHRPFVQPVHPVHNLLPVQAPRTTRIVTAGHFPTHLSPMRIFLMPCGTLLAVSSRTASDGHLVCHNPPFVACPLLKDEDRMRQHVTLQELDEHFTVLPQEHTLFAQKSPAPRLGCAILLKYFNGKADFRPRGTTSQVP